jgi:hypothetical protein
VVQVVPEALLQQLEGMDLAQVSLVLGQWEEPEETSIRVAGGGRGKFKRKAA